MQKKATVVLVKKPRGLERRLEDLHSIVTQAKTEFNARNPHLFLFPENYFGSNFQGTHASNKKILEAIKRALPENWALAFSHNERTGPERVSNTGYVVTRGGHQAQPKRVLTWGEAYQKPAEDEQWMRREIRFGHRDFPRVKLNGIEFEHRVCLDIANSAYAHLNAKQESNDAIAVVSAHKLPIETLLTIGMVPKGTLIINDLKTGAKLVHAGKVRSLMRNALLGRLILSKKGVNIAFYSPKPQR